MMKEPIQQSGHEVSIVIYDAPLPPRYLKFSKKFIRFLYIVVPIFIGIVFITLFLFGLGSRFKDTPAPSMPAIVSDEEARMMAMQSEIENLQTSNKLLQDKLSGLAAAPVEGTQEEPYLMGIKKPYGMQNLMSQNKVSLGQFELINESNKLAFKFQIISTNPETKVTGHVLVFMLSDKGMMMYPATANASMDEGVKFTMGEPFSVSRIRPTTAEFPYNGSENVRFIVYIFSREGDLLLINETQSYKVETKQ